jgi:hypothetical protein
MATKKGPTKESLESSEDPARYFITARVVEHPAFFDLGIEDPDELRPYVLDETNWLGNLDLARVAWPVMRFMKLADSTGPNASKFAGRIKLSAQAATVRTEVKPFKCYLEAWEDPAKKTLGERNVREVTFQVGCKYVGMFLFDKGADDDGMAYEEHRKSPSSSG